MNEVTSKEKATALVFAVVMTVLLIEVGFRLLGPDYHQFNNMLAEYPDNPRGYFDVLRDDGGQKIYGVHMDAAEGLGGRRAPTAARPSILGLGDSQAQGQGVRYEDTLYARLGQALGTRVRNVAVSGYDLDEIVSRYAYEARDPGAHRWVIYAMVLDDFGLDRSKIAGPDFIQFQPGYDFSPWRARSATLNFFAHVREQWTLSQTTSLAYLDSFKGEKLKTKHKQLQALRDAVRADGGRLLIVVWPLLYDFNNYPFHPIHETVHQLARELDVLLVDGLEVLQDQEAQSLWVHSIDHHPNEVAHERMAQAVANVIREADAR